jgi:hypothetical protein
LLTIIFFIPPGALRGLFEEVSLYPNNCFFIPPGALRGPFNDVIIHLNNCLIHPSGGPQALSIYSVDSSFWLKISTQNNLDLSQEHPHSINPFPFLPTFIRSSIICFSISSLLRKVKKGVSLSRCNVDCMPSQIAPFAKTLL